MYLRRQATDLIDKLKKKTTPVSLRVHKAFHSAVGCRKKAYAPYSKFRVGCSVVTSTGEIISGCNVENSSFGATVCAERVAIFTAIAKGFRSFTDIVVVTAPQLGLPAWPCGMCLQVISEFVKPTGKIWIASPKKIISHREVRQLLPCQFTKDSLR